MLQLRDELLLTRITSTMSRLVVFTNTTKSFVAIEPVSHVNNALNMVALNPEKAGELAPLMCVDKDPATLDGFNTLAAEADGFDQPWRLVFAAGLAGGAGQAPDEAAVGQALQRMVESVRTGDIERFIAFDRQGQAVQLS